MKRKMKRICMIVLTFTMLLNPCIVYASPLEAASETENNVESEFESSEKDQEESEVITEEDVEDKIENEETENGTEQIIEELESPDNMIQPEEDISTASDAVEEIEPRGYQGKAVKDTGNTANVVVFVEFADTVHDHLVPGRCYLENPNLTKIFQGDDANPRAMKKYLQNISYNQLEVANIFPQYDAATDKIDSYELKYGVDHYAGSTNGDMEIINEIADILASSGQISSDISLDRDNDGYVDNLMIVVPCESGDTNKKFYGHQSRYIGSKMINSKHLSNYTVVPESDAYMNESSGVLIHEFLHTRGYPDLYLVGASDLNKGPVGPWDIMATASQYVQYPLAYFRSAYSNWFSIPTVRDTMKNYSLYAASAATAQTKDRQAVILKTDYSSTEFFVLEYRKKGEMYNATSASLAYDSLIPESGLIIYRINTAVNQGNAQAPPYMAYVFRQGDTYENGYEKADKNLLNTSVLSSESGRTSFGSSDANATVTENAICYSDGMNSGIVISNVGKTDGDQITFDITFTEEDPDSKWVLESEDTTGLKLGSMDSCRSQDGSIYYISQIGNSSSGGSSALLKYSGGKWSKVADGPVGSTHKIAIYNNEIYVLYRDSKFYVKLDKWTGKGWSNIFKSTVGSNDITMSQSDNGVFFAFTNWDGNAILAYRYSKDKGLKQLGDRLCYSASGSPTNAVISSLGGNTVAVYREANGNHIYVKKYDETTNLWSVLLNGSMQANNAVIEQNGNSLYLLKNGTVFGNNQSYLYVYDMSAPNSKWTQVGTNMVMDSNALEMNICFNGPLPYVIYSNGMDKTYAKKLIDNQWVEMGLKVSSQQVTGMSSYYESGKVYVTYLDSLTNRISIRALQVKVLGEQKIDGKWYYFDPDKDGAMITGFHDFTTKRVYYGPDGAMRYGEQLIDGKWYYFNTVTGAMVTGFYTFSGKTVYYNVEGQMVHGNQEIDGITYYFDPITGAMKTGWVTEGGKTYYYSTRGMAKGELRIGTKWYYFNEKTGEMQTGLVDLGEKTVYYGEDGAMRYGEQKIGGKWYQFHERTGAMITGFYTFSGKTVYYNEEGQMMYGNQEIDGMTYYFNPITGAMKTGWVTEGGKTYYYSTRGIAKGELYINKKWYYFAEKTGEMQTGLVDLGEKTVYYGEDGAMRYGEQKIGGKWYYFNTVTGAMVTGFYTFSGKTVYYNEEGQMVYGNQEIDGMTYYFNPITGAMKTGWVTEGGKTYYYSTEGIAKGELCINKKWYYFAEKTGEMQTGLTDLGEKTVYYGEDGAMRYGEQKTGGKWYYFNTVTGAMVTGFYTFSGKTVYYNEEGQMLYGEQEIEGKNYAFNTVTGAMIINGTFNGKYYGPDGIQM